MKDHQNRFYRNLLKQDHLVRFRVGVQETDLYVHAHHNLAPITQELVFNFRRHIEGYIDQHPGFQSALNPWPLVMPAPAIVAEMVEAGSKAGVGPMAAVAGAIAGRVGSALLAYTPEVVVENGGDIFIKVNQPITIGIYAGSSPLSLQLGLRLTDIHNPIAVCTSSGTIGHSLSLGQADAVCVVAESCALADAIATAAGNLVGSKADIHTAIDHAKAIQGVKGVAVIVGDQLGVWGQLNIVPLHHKKG